ncbi:MAG TPA: DUF3488 and transglutaminase-like domain-containing protein [Actinomycetota bacterium]|nr:DUF3488 and transglutaminase-like domain-containing protein [Actinomycetota bacterium]
MGTEARARLSLGGLVVVIWFAFGQVFGEGPYAGPTLVACLLGGALAFAGGRLGLRPVTTFALSTIGLLWYLVLIFQAGRSFYGLPDPDSLGALGSAMARAYRHASVDYAPVPVRPGYVALTIIGLWVTAAWAEVATFRWRQPLLAAIPAIGLLCMILVVGTGTGATLLVMVFLAALLTFWALESADRLGTWGRWVGARANRTVTHAPSMFSRVARRMAVSSIAAAIVVPLMLPSLGSGLVGWQTGLGGNAGASEGGRAATVDPLVRLAPTLVSQSDQTLFTVTADRAAYWRLVSLTEFDGETWRARPAARVAAENGVIDSPQPEDPEAVEIVGQSYDLIGLGGSYIPAASTPFAVEMESNFERNVSSHPETADLSYNGELENLTYTVQSSLPLINYRQLRGAGPGAADPSYILVPETVRAEVTAIATEWTAGAKTAGQALIAIQQRLRGFEYRLPTEAQIAEEARAGAASAPYLLRFLTEIKAGYCQQFSTAFALLARSLGIPARVSVGFLPGTADALGQTYTVRGTDAHAWPEVYLERWGWVPFEPTPRGEAGVPDYTLTPVQAAANFQRPDAAIFDPSNRVDGSDPRLGDVGEAGGTSPDRRGEARRRAVASERWAAAFERILVVSLVLGGLWFLAIPSLKMWRVRRRYARADGPRALIAAAFGHFEAMATARGDRRSPAESPSSYAARIAAATTISRPRALRLAHLHEAGEYSAEPPESATVREAKALVRDLRAELWRRSSWWTRFGALWSLKGLGDH